VARAFYRDALGMTEVEKPELLKPRGGCWFRAGAAEIHIGVEEGFAPAKKAHPALLVRGLRTLRDRCAAAGVSVVEDQPLDGFDRCYVSDPFGNRLELLEPI